MYIRYRSYKDHKLNLTEEVKTEYRVEKNIWIEVFKCIHIDVLNIKYNCIFKIILHEVLATDTFSINIEVRCPTKSPPPRKSSPAGEDFLGNLAPT